jgi:ubiquinone biosynthesis monooxygenase Coq7
LLCAFADDIFDTMSRQLSVLDRTLGCLDEGLRVVFGPPPVASRPNPAEKIADAELDSSAREFAGRLMRVNHAGEVCAQALYRGQALTTRTSEVRTKMERAAREESDHLAWTAWRIRELQTRTSYSNVLWYVGSFVIGATAGLIGDRWSLGFVAETERQVVEHLDSHLSRLPEMDGKSRAIVEQMREDEGRHATAAVEGGAATIPRPIRALMRLMAKVMTETTYWL